MLSDELIKVIKRLNSHEKKITLITRYGVANVQFQIINDLLSLYYHILTTNCNRLRTSFRCISMLLNPLGLQ